MIFKVQGSSYLYVINASPICISEGCFLLRTGCEVPAKKQPPAADSNQNQNIKWFEKSGFISLMLCTKHFSTFAVG